MASERDAAKSASTWKQRLVVRTLVVAGTRLDSLPTSARIVASMVIAMVDYDLQSVAVVVVDDDWMA